MKFFNSKKIDKTIKIMLIIFGLYLLASYLKINDLSNVFFNKAHSRTIKDVNLQIGKKVLLRAPELTKYIARPNIKYKIVIYKLEQLVEIWADKGFSKSLDKSKSSQDRFEILETYHMTGFSGKLGPKNQQGDRQIPEGVYSIPVLNPNSSYHLSIKLNYPNALDKKRALNNKVKNPGGLIFIHGKSVTIGCVPIGDSNIEEVFYLVSKVGRSKFEVIVAPQKNIESFKYSIYSKNKKDHNLLEKKYKQIKDSLSVLN